MKTYTQAEIDELVRCAKRITDPPKKEMRLERGSYRNEMKLVSIQGDLGFSVFMRVNEVFPENFSIGLEHMPKGEPGSLSLLRCNGPHGEFLGNPPPPHPHFMYHVHRATPETLAAGLRSEAGAEATDRYTAYLPALRHFLRFTQVTNAKEFFPSLWQMRFDFGEEDQEQ